jgi:Spy/CpxP family protein refolding chaperone
LVVFGTIVAIRYIKILGITGGNIMKKILAVLGIAFLVGLLAYPAFSHGPGWGWKHHGMDDSDRDIRHGHMYNRGYEGLSDADRSKLDELDRNYYQETEGLRSQLYQKTDELYALLDSSNPDSVEAKALQSEISDLRGTLDQKRIEYELESRKINSDYRISGKPRWRHGRGYGRGNCWR